jgi:cytochrome c553
MEHNLYKTGDHDAPFAILDCNGDVVLAFCKTCKGAEGSLPTDCPGEPLSSQQQDYIYKGLMDYISGKWVSFNP